MVVKPLIRTCVVLICVFGRSPQAIASSQLASKVNFALPTSAQNSNDKFTHSIDGLYSIPDFRYTDLAQSTMDFSELYQQGQQAQQELTQLLNQISLITHTRPMIPSVKSVERAQTKIVTELNGKVNQLTDIARGTLVANNVTDLISAYELLSQNAHIMEVKNRFRSPAPSGYRDMKLLVTLPNTQHITEIQLHLKEIAAIKNGVEHDIYEEIQNIERQAQVEQRPLSKVEQQQYQQLRQQSLDLYKNAWAQYAQAA